MKRAFQFALAVAILSGLPAHARADELKLKDGTKLIGTIVGFDDNSFKVKTTYGFAIVQKDQVVSISISDAAKKPEPEKKPEPAVVKSPSPAKSPSPGKPADADALSTTANAPPASAPETKLEAPPAIAKTPADSAAKPVASSNGAAPAAVNSANATSAVSAKNSAPAA